MIVTTDLTLRLFEDLKKIAYKSRDFDSACKEIGVMMRLVVTRKAMIEAYNEWVLLGKILPIEILHLQEKNDLKEMAGKYANKNTGMDYCKVLHLFICWMNEEKQD